VCSYVAVHIFNNYILSSTDLHNVQSEVVQTCGCNPPLYYHPLQHSFGVRAEGVVAQSILYSRHSVSNVFHMQKKIGEKEGKVLCVGFV